MKQVSQGKMDSGETRSNPGHWEWNLTECNIQIKGGTKDTLVKPQEDFRWCVMHEPFSWTKSLLRNPEGVPRSQTTGLLRIIRKLFQSYFTVLFQKEGRYGFHQMELWVDPHKMHSVFKGTESIWMERDRDSSWKVVSGPSSFHT